MAYTEASQRKLEETLKKDPKDITILALESSCDETAAAIVRGGRDVISNCVYSQIEMHSEYGGVVPELASRQHILTMGPMVEAALKEAGLAFKDIDAIAVTCGPGLVGSLLIGVQYAKGLALALSLPLLGVNHIEGHICSNLISHKELEPPFLCLIVSGGHSHIAMVEDYGVMTILGKTRDDAAGEAFDKIGRLLGLGYPGGPHLEKHATDGDPSAFAFPRGMKKSEGYDMTFSGLKTAVINTLHKARQAGETIKTEDVAASFQAAVVETLLEKTFAAVNDLKAAKLAVCGGVSANSLLRGQANIHAKECGISLYFPEMKYCGDNAAMIGCAGHYMLLRRATSSLNLNAYPSLKLGQKADE